jgi:hypothetical protein
MFPNGHGDACFAEQWGSGAPPQALERPKAGNTDAGVA